MRDKTGALAKYLDRPLKVWQFKQVQEVVVRRDNEFLVVGAEFQIFNPLSWNLSVSALVACNLLPEGFSDCRIKHSDRPVSHSQSHILFRATDIDSSRLGRQTY